MDWSPQTIEYLSSHECLFSTIIVCNVRLAVELIGRATTEKPKLYILPPKPENLYAKYYISHTHCWNYFTRKKKELRVRNFHCVYNS